MQSTERNENIHMGRNVKRFREMMGLKQEGLAYELGEDWTQKRISVLEQKETIDDSLLHQLAKVLKIPVEAIKNFDEQAAINIISNTYHDNSASVYNNFNPIDKIIELYEALVKSEREKVEMLQKLLEERK